MNFELIATADGLCIVILWLKATMPLTTPHGFSGLGVVALVDVPFLVLQPTHNKQDFADSKEYRHLLKVLGSYMDHYWEEAQKAELKNVTDFWEKYGYLSSKSILAAPSTEMKFMRQRSMVVKTTIQVELFSMG